MATMKIKDLAVKTGEYKNSKGEMKGRYLNVGAVMESDDGGKFIMLNRTFNPAGVPNPDNRDTVILSMFDPKSDESAGGGTQQAAAPRRAPAPQSIETMDDDIPF